MENDPRPVYQKQNSFYEIRHNQKNTLASTLNRITRIRQNSDLIRKMPEAHKKIFKQLCEDLFDYDCVHHKVISPKFTD